MHIYWFTGRSMKDLCATTQISLASGLVERGHELTFFNPDPEKSHENWPWHHHSISNSTFPGRRSRSLGQNMRRWMREHDLEQQSVALVDWRVANFLIPEFRRQKIPWILIDRSPPADKGLLSLLQWPAWKRSWKQAKNDRFGHGCVVSVKHRDFVRMKIGIDSTRITVLPAGVNLEQFKMSKRFEVLTMVYHGQMDQHRGVLSLPMLLQKARAAGIDFQLILIGEGDCLHSLQSIAATNEFITVHPTLKQDELAKVISQCHIGLLPMPERKMWTISSPLKRSEYAASGLLMYGIDHDGHRFSSEQEFGWMKLVQQSEFHDEGVKWLQSLEQLKLDSLAVQSRKYAEEHLSWAHSVNALEETILKHVNQDR